MKRFWKGAKSVPEGQGWGVRLDGKPLRTPGRALLVVPTAPLGEAIAAEWGAVGDRLDPRAMPLTGLANAAIDQVAADPGPFAASLARYADADLACYRAEGPPELCRRQQESWDALLGWARRRFDLDFVVTSGIVHVAQPQITVQRLAHAVAALDPFQLAGLSPLVTIGGSLVAGLAVIERGFTPEQAWLAVSIDESWQLEKWGNDAEAELALRNRHRDFIAAARFLEMLHS